MVLLIALLLVPTRAPDSRGLGPAELPPTAASYRIEARLVPERREVIAEEVLHWRNPADRALDRVPIHLYLNAFSHTGTTWIDGVKSFFGLDFAEHAQIHGDPWGYIEVARVAQQIGAEERLCEWSFIAPDDGNPLDRTLAEVSLAQPVAPGAELVLRLTFTSRLPVPMARTGGKEDYFHVAQWFPKLGVYEPAGLHGVAKGRWAARQFHGPTEFYADFAAYDVTLDVPEGFTVAATGQGELRPGAPAGYHRQRFTQDAVHDFAWVAGRDLQVETHSFRPRGGGDPIGITYVTPVGTERQVARMRRAAEATFDVMGQRVGPYPFSTMTIVQPPWRGRRTAGMEYPTLVTGMPGDPFLDLPGLSRLRWIEGTVVHEVIHNYFQGMVANDEQVDAFLDEGFTSFWTGEVTPTLEEGPGWNALFGYPVDQQLQSRRSLVDLANRIDEPLAKRPAYLFYPGTRRAHIYTRPSLLLRTVRNLYGPEVIDRIFSVYFRRYRFQHPNSADFLRVVDEVASKELAALWREGLGARDLPDYRVAEATSAPWQTPLGYVEGSERLVDADRVAAESDAHYGLDPEALEEDGRVLCEITDPGFVTAGEEQPGRVERRRLEPQQRGVADEELAPESFFRSRVLVRGPGWQHLPVDIRFEFADGLVLFDRWDGRAAWRRYRFLRPAALEEVRIDPEDLLVLDPWPENNGRLLDADSTLGTDFGIWLATVAHWLSLGVASWL